MTANTFKSIEEIKTLTKEKRYYDKYGYVRAWALTTFLTQLETKYKEKFKLLSAHPCIMINKTDKTKTEQFAIGLWVKWLIEETIFYFEMNDNIFFDIRFYKSYIANAKPKICDHCGQTIDARYNEKELVSEYADSTCHQNLYAGFDTWAVTQDVHDTLVANMHKIFAEVQTRNIAMYRSKLPSHEDISKQTIYYN